MKRVLFVAGLLLVAGCAQDLSTTSTDDLRVKEAGIVGVCYSADHSTRQQVIDFAYEACPKGTRNMTIIKHDTFLNSCPISKKNRIVFQCQGFPVQR